MKIQDLIVMGHNPFFGVDHLSSQRGQERESYFSDPRRIIDMIRVGVSMGVGGLMLSTHERSNSVLDLLAGEKLNMRVYPLLPYVQKYVTGANEKGMMNLILEKVSGGHLSDKLRLAWDSTRGLIQKDIFPILSTLIHMELLPFKSFQMPFVFLHDAFTDLALALGLKPIFDFYEEEIKKKYRSHAAYATKNPAILLEKLKEWGYLDSPIMAHVNKTGFSMNPSRETCEEAFLKFETHVMAMSTLASGFLKPDEAYSYLSKVNHIESVVVGASSMRHMDETFSAIKKHMTSNKVSRLAAA